MKDAIEEIEKRLAKHTEWLEHWNYRETQEWEDIAFLLRELKELRAAVKFFQDINILGDEMVLRLKDYLSLDLDKAGEVFKHHAQVLLDTINKTEG